MKYKNARTDMDLLFLSVLMTGPVGARGVVAILQNQHRLFYNPGSAHTVMVRLHKQKYVSMRIVSSPGATHPTHRYKISETGKSYLETLRTQYLKMHQALLVLGLPVSTSPTIIPATISPATISPATISPATISPATISPATISPATISPAVVTPPTITPAMTRTSSSKPAISIPSSSMNRKLKPKNAYRKRP